MPPIEVTRTYLEMRSPGDLRPAASPMDPPRLERIEACPGSFFRYLYAEVGRAYHWTDRLSWPDGQVRLHLGDPPVPLWLRTSRAAPAGSSTPRGPAAQSAAMPTSGLLPDSDGGGGGGTRLT